jgi:LCP family protein required for cell wall assembly
MRPITEVEQIIDPRSAFPGMDRVNVLCMGIDDNWTDSDVEFSRNARTDTLFWMSLDLDSKQISLLSIPRDSYVPIAGTGRRNKINAAYATGGPSRAEYTVGNLFGVMPDYYIVLNINATKNLVDAIGGVDVNVEHAMDYDDSWGHLHVHLHPGFQHLNGDQAVAFARFRHANHGTTFEDGDERRIYRQHVLVRAMVDQTKNVSNWTKIGTIVDIGLSSVRTDMTRSQLLALATLFHGVPQEDITATSLDGDDSMVGDASVFILDQKTLPLYVGWIINGDVSDEHALTRVVVKNASSDMDAGQKAADELGAAGYKVISGGNAAASAQTEIIDTGIPDPNGGAELAQLLGVPKSSVSRQPLQPNHRGWSPPPALTVVLGADFAANSAQSASSL